MCVKPKGMYAHLTENSQDFIFLLICKNLAVCLLGAHTKTLSQWELDTLYMKRREKVGSFLGLNYPPNFCISALHSKLRLYTDKEPYLNR